jgi:PRC-barrel domain
MKTSGKGDPGPQMREPYRLAAATTLIAFSAAVYSAGQDSPMAQPQLAQSAPIGPPQYATVTVFDSRAVQSILGKEVRSAHDENMGRVVNVIADGTGQVKAAVIEFGGFLGVGSRKIAVAWTSLRFLPDEKRREHATLELTRDQVRGVPEFREGKPVVVVGGFAPP